MKQITSLSHMDSPTRDSKTMGSKAMDSKIMSPKTMDFHLATGRLEYTLTNDFLFKSLLQKIRTDYRKRFRFENRFFQ